MKEHFEKKWKEALEFMPVSFATIYGERRENIKDLCYGFFMAGIAFDMERFIETSKNKLHDTCTNCGAGLPPNHPLRKP